MSGKLQAQTSTSFSLKQNMSVCMLTHPETHSIQIPTVTLPLRALLYIGLDPEGGWGSLRQDVLSLSWVSPPQGLIESLRPPSLSLHAVAWGEVIGRAARCRAH